MPLARPFTEFRYNYAIQIQLCEQIARAHLMSELFQTCSLLLNVLFSYCRTSFLASRCFQHPLDSCRSRRIFVILKIRPSVCLSANI